MLRTKEKEVVNEVVGKRKHQPTKIGYFAIVAEVNVRDKRVSQTSESATFYHPTTSILNYTTTTLGNNYN